MESINVKELLASSLFQCKECKKRLSQPVMDVPDVGNICGRCLKKDTHNNAKENTHLSNILSKLHVSCSYNKAGCSVKRLFGEIEAHEDICQYKNRICPFSFINKCNNDPLSSINKHFKKEHAQCVYQYDLKEIRLDLLLESDFEDFHLLIVDEDDYLLRIKLDTAQNSLYFLIYYFKNNGVNFFIRHEDASCSVKDILCNMTRELYLTPAVDPISATKFDLSNLQKYFNKSLTTVITASASISQLANSKLLKFMECSFCSKHMNMQIKQCDKGHSLCRKCIQKFHECPLCKAGLGKARNYALESLCSIIYFPCKNDGCTKYILGEDIENHNSLCTFKQYQCPFLIKLNCKWKGLHEDVRSHLVSQHLEFTVFKDFVERSIEMDYLNHKYDTICIILGKHIFKVCVCVNSSNKFFLTYGLYGPPSLDYEFHWETGIYHKNSDKRKFVVKDLCLTYTTMNYKLNIETYDVNDTIYFYHKIH